jgi:hypothetical protein
MKMGDAESTARAQRARSREGWPVRRFRLGDEPSDDLSASTTPIERLAMVWPLSISAFELAGHPPSRPRREQMPGRVVRNFLDALSRP